MKQTKSRFEWNPYHGLLVPSTEVSLWCNRWEEQSAPAPETSDWEISADLSGKERQENMENGAEKKENWEREGGKMKMEWGKVKKWGEDLFFYYY